MARGQQGAPLIEWAVASKPHPNATVCGDACFVKALDGSVLVGAIDGLGHGPEAAAAAECAVEIAEANAAQPLGRLVSLCDQALRGMRGAAMSLARLDADARQLTWIGVGNVEGLFLPVAGVSLGRQSLLLQGGVVGSRLPPLRESSLPLSASSLIVFATDGIATNFAEACDTRADLQRMTNEILGRYGKKSDDALVLAVRYLGAAA